MRNAIICAGMMLAIFLIWPMLFGGGLSPAVAAPTARHAGGTTMLVPPAKPAPSSESYEPVEIADRGTPQTCTQRYARVAPVCTSDDCRQRVIDALDICQGTGFWPE